METDTDQCANKYQILNCPNNYATDKVQSDEVNQNVASKWDRFAEWIHAVCVVTFDLELGQAMEVSVLCVHY